MQVIISGCNRMEFCTVKKKKDFDRRFFLTRGQLYFVPTNALVRMRVYEFGKERPSEAVIAYEENKIIPYERKGMKWTMDTLLAAIDRYKMMTDSSYGNKPWFENVAKIGWKYLTTPTAIILIIVLYLFLSGGIKI